MKEGLVGEVLRNIFMKAFLWTFQQFSYKNCSIKITYLGICWTDGHGNKNDQWSSSQDFSDICVSCWDLQELRPYFCLWVEHSAP